MDITILFIIAILIFSVVIHEVSHGYAALMMGDVTAKYAGRLTLNPIKHLDPFGSVILPLFLAILPGNFVFGWAKPVPYNPYNLKNRRWGELVVALAGPLSNILVAVLFGFVVRIAIISNFSSSFISLAIAVIFINLVLAIFNLIPIPPLDGSKILFNLFPNLTRKIQPNLERYGFILILLFIVYASSVIIPIVLFFASFLTGVPLIQLISFL